MVGYITVGLDTIGLNRSGVRDYRRTSMESGRSGQGNAGRVSGRDIGQGLRRRDIGSGKGTTTDGNWIEDGAYGKTLLLLVDTTVGFPGGATVGAGETNQASIAADLASVTVDTSRGT